MRILSAFIVGLIFGVGIAISGMINPAKVLNFFDIAGTWDPSLIFVMGGALVTTFIGYRLVLIEVAGFVVALLAGLWVARTIRDRQTGKGALA